MHWEKRSLWEESTHVPLVMVAPDGVNVGAECTRSVGLIDIYPTLVELCGLPTKQDLQGNSLVPLLENPSQAWKFPALTTHHPGNHSVRTERWRYIQYANGDEELYDHDADPHEWKNLANDPDYAAVKDRCSPTYPQDQRSVRSPPTPAEVHAGVRLEPTVTSSIDFIYYAWNNRGVCQMTVWMPVVWTVAQTHESEK